MLFLVSHIQRERFIRVAGQGLAVTPIVALDGRLPDQF